MATRSENKKMKKIKINERKWIGRDLTWYAKKQQGGSASGDAVAAEQAAARARDEAVMSEALGYAPKSTSAPTRDLNAVDMQHLLQRGTMEREQGDVERVEGLGAAPYVVRGEKTLLIKREIEHDMWQSICQRKPWQKSTRKKWKLQRLQERKCLLNGPVEHTGWKVQRL